VILEKIPVFSKFVSQPMDQARIRFLEKDIPVAIGGVAIYPEDLIVADGDGAIVVPEAIIDGVLKYAIQESENDKCARAMLFDALGIPRNGSTKNTFDVAPHPYAMTPEELKRRLRR